MKDLAKKIVEKLTEKNIRISFAETITGGGVAKEIIKIPGSSRVIDFSLTTYSNQSKIDFLKVSETTLIDYGAVSEEVVEEMVNGLLDITCADVGLALSGVAGPSGVTATKPTGMVCVAIKKQNEVIKDTWFLDQLSREKIIELTIMKCLEFILNSLD